MEQKELIHKILQAVNDIEKYTDTFIEQEQIPLVEVDIALEKTRILYDFLHKLKTAKPIAYKSQVIEELTPQPVEDEVMELLEDEETVEIVEIQETLEGEQVEISTEQVPEAIVAEQAEVEKELVVEKAEEPEHIVEQEHIEEDEIVEVNEPQIQSSKPTPVIPTPDNDLAHKLSKKPVSNIATAIGINDRFQYQNDLFNRQADVYNETIQELNNLSSFNEALDLLQSKFDWDYEDQIVQRFVAIVERRYL